MRILIVDDEMAALTKMKILLSSYGECTLSTTTGQAIQLCIKAIQANIPFDFITIDIQLGKESGHDLLEAINRLELKANISPAKKFMVTASGTKDNLMRAYSKGCDGFVVKPVKRDDLEQKMLSLGYAKKGI